MLLGYDSVASMLRGRSRGEKLPLAKAVQANVMRAEARAQRATVTPDTDGTYMRARQRTKFEPDYDRHFWHHPWLYPAEPRHESYPNTYTEWRAVPVNTPSRDLKADLSTLSALVKLGIAGVALYLGMHEGALNVGTSAIEDIGSAICYSQPVDIAWHPYFYAPREGVHKILAHADPYSEPYYFPMGPSTTYTKEPFKQYPYATSYTYELPPGTRIIVYQGLEDFLNPYGNPENVVAYAYPPYFTPDETGVQEKMARYPSFIVQPDGSLHRVN